LVIHGTLYYDFRSMILHPETIYFLFIIVLKCIIGHSCFTKLNVLNVKNIEI